MSAEYFSQKLESTISLIEEIEAIDFPHNDAHDALVKIKGDLKDLLSFVTIPLLVKSPVIFSGLHLQVVAKISDALDLIGFVVNSANVRNAFEIHGPLSDVAKKLIGQKSQLIFSFEWNYVPFTYPLTFPSLPNFVLIGLPASEATNALVLPAVGHELGHSLWRSNIISDQFHIKDSRQIKCAIF